MHIKIPVADGQNRINGLARQREDLPSVWASPVQLEASGLSQRRRANANQNPRRNMSPQPTAKRASSAPSTEHERLRRAVRADHSTGVRGPLLWCLERSTWT